MFSPTFSPPTTPISQQPHIPDPSDINPNLLRTINKPPSILKKTSSALKSLRRFSQPDLTNKNNKSLPKDNTPSTSRPLPSIPSRPFSPNSFSSSQLYPQISPPRSSYNTRSSENLFSPHSQDSNSITFHPRSRYNLRSSHQLHSNTPSEFTSPSSSSIPPSLDRSSTITLSPNTTSGFSSDSARSNTSSLVPNFACGHLFTQDISDLSSEHTLINHTLSTVSQSTPPSPRRENYPFLLNGTLISHPREDPRFTFYALHKINTNPTISQNRKNKEIARLQKDKLQIKFEITVEFFNLQPHPVSSHANVTFKTTPSPFITTNLRLLVLDTDPFTLIDGSIEFINPITLLKYKTNF